MALTIEDLDALEQAIAGGVLRVRTSEGKDVVFDSFNQLLARRDWVRGQLGLKADGGASASRVVKPTFGKGL